MRMYSATVTGPPAAMRRFRRSRAALCGMLRRASRALVRRRSRLAHHQIEAEQEHGHAEDLAPGHEAVGAEIHLRLAEDFADRARDRISDQEEAAQHPEPLADPLLARRPEQEDEQHNAFER